MRYFTAFLFIVVAFSTFAQGSDEKLANLYYDRGEFDKAIPYFERIIENSSAEINFNRLYECYMQTDNNRDAEKLIKRQIKKSPYDYVVQTMLGTFYEETGRPEKAVDVYEEIISDLPASANSVIRLYKSFRAKNLNEYALKTLIKGDKMLKGTYPLQLQFADYYGATGDSEKMLDSYMELLENYPNYSNYVQNILGRQIDFSAEGKEYNYLKSNLLTRVQRNPNEATFSNMLVWLFVQTKSFGPALTQIIAIDKRENNKVFV